MKRQDELNEAWCKYMGKCSTEIMQALAFALRWCDEHPVVKVGGALKNYERGYEDAIDKACEWLEEFMQITPSKKTFIKRFKQAMKGECYDSIKKFQS